MTDNATPKGTERTGERANERTSERANDHPALFDAHVHVHSHVHAHTYRKTSQRMLKASTIDPPAPELPRSPHKLRERRLGRSVLRAIGTTRHIFFIHFILSLFLLGHIGTSRQPEKMSRRVDHTKTIFVFCEFPL